ncbi:TetR/AcrR family transcriptional regulator [Streptosporangium roseum]|uniref:Transcriptional regulator, TetR family n=1 Tax=Streptosporangium roseum (strain ATCC 12428 / DSM 43021 / JCM 3005 / KCTC 9067 / NCIMB 10171 / NRRL 2505 / NI 9100) TaxID=479432 RepID=D2BDG1_STRRD|nr:TetR/AcrR family transcriptional regulator [Streptosporangium roseum]ACZ86250.1 putative transcriptional regulator, TetR family [Streptosporangium roseum DSM 43021]
MRLDPRRERAILDATMELLSEVGFDRMSVDQIARRASASKATIYRRWPGKEALVVDLVCNHLEIDVAPPPDTGSMRGDLVAVVAGFCRTLEQKHGLVFALVPALLTAPGLAAALRANVPRPDITGTVPLLDRARERGELPGGADPGEIRRVTEALVWHRLLITGEPLDGAFAEETVDRVLLPLIRAWSTATP